MTQMKEWGNKLFTGKVYVKPDAPRFHVKPTWEIEEPYRYAAKTLHIKLFKSGYSWVIGLWRPTDKPISIHLLEALRGRQIDTQAGEIRQKFRAPGESAGSAEDSSDLEYA